MASCSVLTFGQTLGLERSDTPTNLSTFPEESHTNYQSITTSGKSSNWTTKSEWWKKRMMKIKLINNPGPGIPILRCYVKMRWRPVNIDVSFQDLRVSTTTDPSPELGVWDVWCQVFGREGAFFTRENKVILRNYHFRYGKNAIYFYSFSKRLVCFWSLRTKLYRRLWFDFNCHVNDILIWLISSGGPDRAFVLGCLAPSLRWATPHGTSQNGLHSHQAEVSCLGKFQRVCTSKHILS